jgi:hypothetical protein
MSGESSGHDENDKPETGAEEVLKEFRDSELRLDDGQPGKKEKEAADALLPSEPLQESAQKKGSGDEDPSEDQDQDKDR